MTALILRREYEIISSIHHYYDGWSAHGGAQ